MPRSSTTGVGEVAVSCVDIVAAQVSGHGMTLSALMAPFWISEVSTFFS